MTVRARPKSHIGVLLSVSIYLILIFTVFATIGMSAAGTKEKTVELRWGTDEFKAVDMPVALSLLDGVAQLKCSADVEGNIAITPQTIDVFIMTSSQYKKYQELVESRLFYRKSQIDFMESGAIYPVDPNGPEVEYRSSGITSSDTYYIVFDIYNQTVTDFQLTGTEAPTIISVTYGVDTYLNILLIIGIIVIIVVIIVAVVAAKLYKKSKAKRDEEKKKLEAMQRLRQEEAEIDRRLQEALVRSSYDTPQTQGQYQGVIDPKTQALLEEQRRKKMEEEMELRQREMALQQSPQYPQYQQYQQPPGQAPANPQQYPQQYPQYQQSGYGQRQQHRHPPQY